MRGAIGHCVKLGHAEQPRMASEAVERAAAEEGAPGSCLFPRPHHHGLLCLFPPQALLQVNVSPSSPPHQTPTHPRLFLLTRGRHLHCLGVSHSLPFMPLAPYLPHPRPCLHLTHPYIWPVIKSPQVCLLVMAHIILSFSSSWHLLTSLGSPQRTWIATMSSPLPQFPPPSITT